jgi:hypothetical protein
MSGWMHGRRAVAICAGVALCTAALACQTPYEQAYGRSYSEYRAATIENPEAGADDLEAPRTDAQSSDAALYKLREHEPKVDEGEPPRVINVDIGS